jgi:hypothetical protein
MTLGKHEYLHPQPKLIRLGFRYGTIHSLPGSNNDTSLTVWAPKGYNSVTDDPSIYSNKEVFEKMRQGNLYYFLAELEGLKNKAIDFVGLPEFRGKNAGPYFHQSLKHLINRLTLDILSSSKNRFARQIK